jgi:uncharacterized protein involved in exopolysaccharide biosynthesis|tara:strand:+ start:304 stop:1314 length:1011 start_codon:yes stop_codon:yes gene_type:complete
MAEDVSVKQILKELVIISKILLKKWLNIGISGLIGGLLMFFGYKSFIKPKFESVTTLSLADSNPVSAVSNYLALASQFGIPGGSKNTEGKFIALLESKRNFTSALMTLTPTGEKLINYYLGLEGDYTTLKRFTFKGDNQSELSFIEDSLLNKSILVALKNTVITDHDKESNLITLKVSSPDELFAYYFNNQLITAVIQHFTSQASKKEKDTYNIIKLSVDSVVNELKIKEEELAKVKDKGNNIVRKQGNIKEMRLMRDVKILSLMYSEGLKNLELAKISFLEKKPVIEIIDQPILPLDEKKISDTLLLIYGGSLFGGLSILVILFKHYINLKEILK